MCVYTMSSSDVHVSTISLLGSSRSLQCSKETHSCSLSHGQGQICDIKAPLRLTLFLVYFKSYTVLNMNNQLEVIHTPSATGIATIPYCFSLYSRHSPLLSFSLFFASVTICSDRQRHISPALTKERIIYNQRRLVKIQHLVLQ